jgi:DNA-binding response OmpR family regulator
VIVKRILIVADETEPVRALRRHLEEGGYHVLSAQGGANALECTLRERPDLILLDLALSHAAASPGQEPSQQAPGRQLCLNLRRASGAPILVLTSSVEEAEWAIAGASRADDYILEPYFPWLVEARVRALLRWAERRRAGEGESNLIQAGDLVLNPSGHQASVAGRPVDLTRTELALLVALVSAPGQALTRRQLAGALDRARAVSERTIDSHIKNLREKIEPDARHPHYVLTVHGVGYKLGG